MAYFSNFPKVLWTQNGISTIGTNLLARVNFIPELIKNPAVFYEYKTQEGDTPEIIAAKYYDDPYRYWLFLYGNEIIDPQWDLPLNSKTFEIYLNDKYKAEANTNNQSVLEYTKSTVKEYRKLVITYDSGSDTTTTSAFIVDQSTYANLPSNVVTTKYFSSGDYVKVTETKNTVNIYDYELDVNDKKSNKKIINNVFAEDLEDKLKDLLST